MSRSLSIILILLFIATVAPSIYAVNFSSCGTISSSNTYEIDLNISTAQATCITISAHNVNITCQGNHINDTSGSGTSFSATARQNVSIRDCFITGAILYTNTNNSRVTNTTVTGSIITFSSGNSNSIISTTLNTSNTYGITLSDENRDNVTDSLSNRTFYGGLRISGGGSHNVTNVTVLSTQFGGTGILVESTSTNNRIINSTVRFNLGHGVYLSSGGGNIVNGTTADGNVQNGFNVDANNQYLGGNTAYNNSIGFVITASHMNFTNNTAFNNTRYGFSVSGATNVTLTNSNASNNTLAHYQITTGSNVTFSGTSYAQNGSLTALDLNITNNATATTLNATGYANFTTDFGTIFFASAKNVSIKLMNLSNSGAATSGCASSFTGNCTLITINHNVVNISNTSGSATINLGMFYNVSYGVTSSSVYVGRYSSGWAQAGQTAVDTSAGTVRYDSLTSFSTFAAVNFSETSDTTTTTSTTSTTNTSTAGKQDVPAPSISYACSDNHITLNTLSEFTGGTAQMYYFCNSACGICEGGQVGSHISSINSKGEALFTYYGPGEYQFTTTSVGSSTTYRATTSGYNLQETCYIPTTACQAPPTIPPVDEPLPEPSIEPPVTPVSPDTPPPTEEPPLPPVPQPPPSEVEYDLFTHGSRHVGEEQIITGTRNGKPCAFCTFLVTNPRGDTFTLKADGNGKATLPLDFKGKYAISLLDDGKVVKQRDFSAQLDFSLDSFVKKPVVFLEDLAPTCSAIVLIIVLVLILLYMRRRNEQKKPYKFKPKEDSGE